MNYAEIKYCDIANGVGVRTSLFVSGCRHHCPYCFNEIAWNFDLGQPFDAAVEETIISSLAPNYVNGLTILGGEPMEPENQVALAPFLERVRAAEPDKSIWMYTGFTWEELIEGPSRAHIETTPRILAALDVIVDGRFVQAQKDITLRFRGSANQRIIDVAKSFDAGAMVTWEDDPIFATHDMTSDGRCG